MAEDDYAVIAFKILVYYYGLLKRKYSFSDETFTKALIKANITEEYLIDILYMLKNSGYIQGIVFAKAWGNEKVIISDLVEASITADGIHYISENDTMKKVKDFLLQVPGAIAELIRIVL